jgi:hypothetical protein
MNRSNAGWVVAGVVALLAIALGAAAPESQVGRFQIISATAKFSGMQGNNIANAVSVDMPEVFLLDSKTGQAWTYVSVVHDNNSHTVWAPVDEARR